MEGQFLLHAGRTDEAIARLREAIELDSRSRVAHMFAASAYIEKGLFSEAVAEAGAAHAHKGIDNPFFIFWYKQL